MGALGKQFIFAAVLAGSLATSAWSQQALPATTTTVSGVTVTAPPRKQELAKFVYDYARLTANGTYARWSRPVCPLAVGIKDEDRRYFEQRIKDIAQQVGAGAGGDACDANLMILFTDDQPKTLKRLVSRRFDLFGQHYVAELKDWAQSRAPVVVWYAVDWAPLFGGAHASDFTSAGIIQAGSATAGAPMRFQTNMDISPSRLESPIKDEFTTVILVVDIKRVNGLKPSAVSAYLAMAGLGEFNLDAKGDGSTILTLFRDEVAGRTPPDDLTPWDVAYLKGLYRSNPRVFGSLQRGQLLATMERVTAEMIRKPLAGR